MPLLDELRALARTFSDDAASHLRLAGGLFNTLNRAKTEDDFARRDDLRTLARTFPDDAAVHLWLAQRLAQHAEQRHGRG